jgi:phage replication O-like protein O
MANPQTEEGYTRIANEIFEALAGIRIPGEARQCLDVILRKTYGYNKKEDKISLSQFCLITHLGKEHVCKALLTLAKINIIITQKGNGYISSYRFNKDFDTWKPLPKKVTITQKGNKPLPNRVHTKDNIQKKEYMPPAEVLPSENQSPEFSHDSYIEKMLANPNQAIVIMAKLIKGEGLRFKSHEHASHYINQNIRAANKLKAYPFQDVVDCYEKMKKEPFWDGKINLNTLFSQLINFSART